VSGVRIRYLLKPETWHLNTDFLAAKTLHKGSVQVSPQSMNPEPVNGRRYLFLFAAHSLVVTLLDGLDQEGEGGIHRSGDPQGLSLPDNGTVDKSYFSLPLP